MNMPEQYKTGIAYFMDFEFKVSPDTFIPRPETELLVEKAIETVKNIYAIRNTQYAIRILDIGTGCGNIAISLTKYLAQSKITTLDISHSALLKAKENAESLGVIDRIYFIESDLLNSLKTVSAFDIIVCNLPYISQGDMIELPEIVKEEPTLALYGGNDGLDFVRKIIKESVSYLKPKGTLLMEIGYDQSKRVKILLEERDYQNIEIFKDYNGIDRIVKAQNG